MPRFRVVYQQREVRACTIEAVDKDDALRQIRHLVDRDGLPPGEFESASEQQPLTLTDEADTVIDYFEDPSWEP